MAKNLTLIPHQSKELESDLIKETFLKDHEKNPAYKQAFDFKNRMFQSLKSQRTSLVSILKLTDEVTAIKQRVDEALDMSGAVAAFQEHPESRALGLGEEDVPVIFKPLLSSPKVPLVMDMGQLDLSDIRGLTIQQIKMI